MSLTTRQILKTASKSKDNYLTIAKVAQKLNVSHATISLLVNDLFDRGELTFVPVGRAKILRIKNEGGRIESSWEENKTNLFKGQNR